jgi:hypothetical protein
MPATAWIRASSRLGPELMGVPFGENLEFKSRAPINPRAPLACSEAQVSWAESQQQKLSLQQGRAYSDGELLKVSGGLLRLLAC